MRSRIYHQDIDGNPETDGEIFLIMAELKQLLNDLSPKLANQFVLYPMPTPRCPRSDPIPIPPKTNP